jgi:hypothetical protein
LTATQEVKTDVMADIETTKNNQVVPEATTGTQSLAISNDETKEVQASTKQDKKSLRPEDLTTCQRHKCKFIMLGVAFTIIAIIVIVVVL